MSLEGTNRVIDFAVQKGFTVTRTRKGHLKMTREGCPALFFSGTPSDHRAIQNGIAKIKRALRDA